MSRYSLRLPYMPSWDLGLTLKLLWPRLPTGMPNEGLRGPAATGAVGEPEDGACPCTAYILLRHRVGGASDVLDLQQGLTGQLVGIECVAAYTRL
ncbi:hypothetical protein NDU88_002402 [Pleurodeles waltl]|uniref:Uncharacterized protein n=1 Tax=Pleurodeles waltl TaxID=8319 RepID=A0AAV7W4G1_PLEWA|nr:hypothetical protein NDU88_002402 [Pleurodeles waltl]